MPNPTQPPHTATRDAWALVGARMASGDGRGARTPAQHAFEQWGYLMARGDFAGAREALKKAKGGVRG